jgi:hypothetical protein
MLKLSKDYYSFFKTTNLWREKYEIFEEHFICQYKNFKIIDKHLLKLSRYYGIRLEYLV